MDKQRKPIVLECTIRDGSYNVKFKFTENDTRRVTQELANLGFKWIEIGHGLGLGAMRAGKGDMPSGDLEMIRAARETKGDARIGAFFIPGIGTREDILAARDNGLEFIRIGYDADRAEVAFPFLEYARSLGYVTCFNMMKSYALTPEEFAVNARGSVNAGADIVYCVDSAGGMMPDEVATYFQATAALVGCPMGFHGHNNLMMAVSNCLAAYASGADYLDTTLCGLGRSSGNAPSEILVAALARIGADTGIDLFALMDLIDHSMWPLVASQRPHDMMAVTLGYTRFHSGFLSKVVEQAARYSSEVRRLVARVAEHDQVRLDEIYLAHAAGELAGTAIEAEPESLARFHAPDISHERISNSIESMQALITGLGVARAKRPGVHSVLHLVPMEDIHPDGPLSEFVLEDHLLVLGRVMYGSMEMLQEVLKKSFRDISYFMVSRTDLWARGALELVRETVPAGQIIPVSDAEIRHAYIREVLEELSISSGRGAILLYGAPVVQRILHGTDIFDRVFAVGQSAEAAGSAVTLQQLDDWKHVNLKFDAVVCGSVPTHGEIASLRRVLLPQGRIVVVQSGSRPFEPNDVACVNVDIAFSSLLDRHLRISDAIRKTQEQGVRSVEY